MIGDSDGLSYEDHLEEALNNPLELAGDPPKRSQYQEDYKGNWNKLTPNEQLDLSNSWATAPGDIMPEKDVLGSAKNGGFYFTPDYKRKDLIDRLHRENDFDRYEMPNGGTILKPKGRAPEVG